MDSKEYNTNLRKISEAQIGLEMVNHIQNCPSCAKILNEANQTIVKHIRETLKI
jgi:hypothetical protein